MKRFILTTAALAITALSAPATAQDAMDPLEAEGVRIWNMLPRPSELARHPGAEGWYGYGVGDPRTVDVPELPGGKAQRFTVKSAGKNAWDAGFQTQNQMKIGKGDVIFAAFWARADETPDGAATATIPVALQMAEEPYTAFANTTAELGTQWELVTLYGTAPQKFRKEAMVISLQGAGGKQVIDLGPVYLMNMGKGAVTAAQMPGARPAF